MTFIKRYKKLLPVVLFIIGLGISSWMFYKSIISPLHSIETLEPNYVYDFNISRSRILTIFIDDREIERLRVDDYDNFQRMTYFKDNVEYNVLLNVLDYEENSTEYEVNVIHNTKDYNVSYYHGVFTIHFKEPGLYQFAIYSYDDIDVEFGVLNTDINATRTNFIVSLVIGSMFIASSLVLFYKMSNNPKKDA